MIRMTVLYPRNDDTTFDWDYYRTQHAQLIADRWGEHLQRSETAKGLSGVPKGDPDFVAIYTVYFSDRDALQSALRAGGADVQNDIPNFTNVQPIMQIDEVV